MEHPNQIMENYTHRFAGRSCVTMGYLYCDFFVLADHKLWVIFTVINNRVVESAEARTWVHGDVLDVVLSEQINDDVRLIFFVLISIHCSVRVSHDSDIVGFFAN